MKDFELVQFECCNYNGRGCDGINGRHFPTWFPEGIEIQTKCLKAQGKHCEYFRLVNRVALCDTCRQNAASVAAGVPGAKHHKAVGYDAGWLKDREERLKAGDRVCAHCGELRKKGHRYCQACRARRARWNHNRKMARYMKKHRKSKLRPVIPFCGYVVLRWLHRSGYFLFQMAEVAVPRDLFSAILERITRLWLPPPLPSTT